MRALGGIFHLFSSVVVLFFAIQSGAAESKSEGVSPSLWSAGFLLDSRSIQNDSRATTMITSPGIFLQKDFIAWRHRWGIGLEMASYSASSSEGSLEMKQETRDFRWQLSSVQPLGSHFALVLGAGLGATQTKVDMSLGASAVSDSSDLQFYYSGTTGLIYRVSDFEFETDGRVYYSENLYPKTQVAITLRAGIRF